jgi:uncharacterized protein (TIGR03083 family)
MTEPSVERRTELLGAAWAWWAEVLRGATEADWHRETRLEGWDVHALVAHHGMFVQGLAFLAAAPVDAAPATPDAAAMLRRFNAPDGVAHELADAVAELARAQAASASPGGLVQRFAVDGPAVLDTVRRAGPIVVDYFGNGPFPIAEACSIGVLEAVVHGLDLARALGREPDLPASSEAHAVTVLAAVPDPVAFLEAGSGRSREPVLPVLR